MKTLNGQRQRLESRLDELDRLTASQTEIRTVVSDTMRFLAALPFTLRDGVSQEKIGVLRQCVDGTVVDESRTKLRIAIRPIPVGGNEAKEKVYVPLRHVWTLSGLLPCVFPVS